MLKRDFLTMLTKPCFDDPNGEITEEWLMDWIPTLFHGALSGDRQVKWIVTEGNDPELCADGEFGVEVGGKPYFYYKHSTTGPSSPDLKYREIEKHEFGETINREKINVD